ncbi:MAG: hypothetical protein QGI09_07995 [Dehalococcoidia bacterium]|nr:hypothetical protein [Dehalococcoidia bacterium]
MDIVFEKGNQEEPKGHALVYFRSSSDPEQVLGAYLVILPITVEVSKYMPPFLMNQVGELGPKDMSAFAFPPVPENLEGHVRLVELAVMRDDDIIYCGTINPADVPSAMMALNEAVQWYAEKYSQMTEARHPEKAEADQEIPGFDVNEVLYGLMSDNDKLSELTRLVGRLRFVVEGGEKVLAQEAETEINLLAKYLPENHQISRLIEAAKAGGSVGARLADLYLQRCFHLIQQEYIKLGQVEAELKSLEAGESAG